MYSYYVQFIQVHYIYKDIGQYFKPILWNRKLPLNKKSSEQPFSGWGKEKGCIKILILWAKETELTKSLKFKPWFR